MRVLTTFLWYLLLICGAILMLLPFAWMILTSLQPATTTLTMPTNWLPRTLQWVNYQHVWQLAPFTRYWLNSLLVTTTTTLGQLFSSLLAAFAFTHLQFYGRRFLFGLLVALMLVPGELLLIPNFVTIAQLHWVNTYAALIIPWLASVFMVVTLHQAFQSQPRSLYYAAHIDGASDWQYLWHILVPTNRPIITAVAVLQVIASWNAFMWPLIMTNSEQFRTLPVGLMAFTSEQGTNYPLLMAASVCVILPLLILYVCLQKYLMLGITQSRWKGSTQ
ncbi:carbohydrate ABC transporter permease [Levilactobacillus suantsaiihabitans]|uniref:Carbohydrate ABC transporter permease n=1 Tax=Levilactobacillus suantsaiihabitans TaxID=2487722 RepID=A0A4Z0JF33_9LACO|nr:carbohydrate ABC transporter permease [Levilactobacillus suantsaiihabitans]TGD20454.1 carbohydrate ABC transporter permease [Levilactobacillus suantsaiihabitans]